VMSLDGRHKRLAAANRTHTRWSNIMSPLNGRRRREEEDRGRRRIGGGAERRRRRRRREEDRGRSREKGERGGG